MTKADDCALVEASGLAVRRLETVRVMFPYADTESYVLPGETLNVLAAAA